MYVFVMGKRTLPPELACQLDYNEGWGYNYMSFSSAFEAQNFITVCDQTKTIFSTDLVNWHNWNYKNGRR